MDRNKLIEIHSPLVVERLQFWGFGFQATMLHMGLVPQWSPAKAEEARMLLRTEGLDERALQLFFEVAGLTPITKGYPAGEFHV